MTTTDHVPTYITVKKEKMQNNTKSTIKNLLLM